MKILTNKIIWGVFFTIFIGILCLGCNSSNPVSPNNPDNQNNTGNQQINVQDYPPGQIPGMGSEEGPLTGSPFHLPDGIELVGNIKGANPFISKAKGKNYCQNIGSGLFVMLDLKLKNHLDQDTTFALPAGLTFAANSPDYQSGILIQGVKVHLSKGKTCHILLHSYCINENKEPSDYETTYDVGPVTNAKPMIRLIHLLENKQIKRGDIMTSSLDGMVSSLQGIVWDITNDNGLTSEDSTYIKSLKNS